MPLYEGVIEPLIRVEDVAGILGIKSIKRSAFFKKNNENPSIIMRFPKEELPEDLVPQLDKQGFVYLFTELGYT